MNEAFEKILDRLRNLAENYGRLQFGFNDSCEIQKYVGMEQSVDLAIEIVQEVAEEYNQLNISTVPLIHQLIHQLMVGLLAAIGCRKTTKKYCVMQKALQEAVM